VAVFSGGFDGEFFNGFLPEIPLAYPEPMDDKVLLGPALSAFMDPTLENLVPVISEEEELPVLFFRGFNRMAKHRLSISLL
jgi:hypothetical protein